MPELIASADDYAVWLVAVVGGLTALGWLVRKIWKPLKRLMAVLDRVDTVIDLAEHELRPNSGSSLYDKIGRIENQQADLFSIVDDLSEKFDTHLGTQAEANRAMWPAVEAIANAMPAE